MFESLTFASGIDSSLADNLGRSVMYFTSATTTLLTITYIGGPPFLAAAVVLGVLYYNGQFYNNVDIARLN